MADIVLAGGDASVAQSDEDNLNAQQKHSPCYATVSLHPTFCVLHILRILCYVDYESHGQSGICQDISGVIWFHRPRVVDMCQFLASDHLSTLSMFIVIWESWAS